MENPFLWRTEEDINEDELESLSPRRSNGADAEPQAQSIGREHSSPPSSHGGSSPPRSPNSNTADRSPVGAPGHAAPHSKYEPVELKSPVGSSPKNSKDSGGYSSSGVSTTVSNPDAPLHLKSFLRAYLPPFLPISLLFCLSLVLSNSVYLYLSVAFIQMIKAMTPIVVLSLSFCCGLETFSGPLLFIVCVVCCGVVISVMSDEGRFPKQKQTTVHVGDKTQDFGIIFPFEFYIGLVLQLLAVLVEASRLILVQITLSGKPPADTSGSPGQKPRKRPPLVQLKEQKLSAFQMNLCVAPLCFLWCALLFTLALYFDERGLGGAYQDVSDRFFDGPAGRFKFLLCALGNGGVAIGLNLVSYQLIQKTSSLVLALSGIFKDILIVCMDMVVYATNVGPMQFGGFSMSLFGIWNFNNFKKDKRSTLTDCFCGVPAD